MYLDIQEPFNQEIIAERVNMLQKLALVLRYTFLFILKERGQCTVYYTSPQSFLIRWLNNFRDFSEF